MRGRRRTALLALALLAAPAAATAQNAPNDEAEARRRFERGVELTDEGNASAAMVEFTRAYELTRNPLLLYNISATHEALGHYVEALDALERYAAGSPPAAVARRRAELDAALARLRQRIGTLVVPLDVPGLELRVDGVLAPAGRARAGLSLSAGRHRVALSAPGHVAREADVDVAGGERVELREPLVRAGSTLAVRCNVPDAEVVVDGRVLGRTPLASPLPVDEGAHQVELRRPGYASFSTQVNARGTGAQVEAELAWSAAIPEAAAARLRVEASEPDVLVFVDGRRVSADGRDAIPPGAHRLRVERADFLPTERDVVLPAGATRSERVVLLPTPAYRADYEATARSARRTGWIVLGAGAAALLGGAAGAVVAHGMVTDREDEAGALEARDAYCRGPHSAECPSNAATDAREGASALRDSDIPQAQGLRAAMIGVAGLGLAGAVTGVVLLARAPRGDRFAATAWRPVVGLGWVSLERSF